MKILELSKSQQISLAGKVAELERDFPLEIKIVIRESKLHFPEGGLRVLALLTFFVLILFWFYWIPMPAFFAATLLVVAICLPFSAHNSIFSAALSALPGSRLLTYSHERNQELYQSAQHAFAKNAVGATKESNGLLMYFALREKKFYILPDTGLQKYVNKGTWQSITQTVSGKLANEPAETKLEMAISEALQILKRELAGNLPQRTLPQEDNEISNFVLFE